MIIVFDKIPEYCIRIENSEHIVEKKLWSEKREKHYWVVKGYFPKIDQCIRCISDHVLQDTDKVLELKDFKKFMLDFEDRISNMAIETKQKEGL